MLGRKGLRVLHICNDFFGTPVYTRLFKSLDRLGVDQTILVFLRNDQVATIRKMKAQLTKEHRVVTVQLSKGVSSLGRVVPSLRNKYVLKSLKDRIDFNSFDIIHAHTLFSNGSLARKISKESGLPYLLSVRSVDVNMAYTYLRHLRYSARQTTLGASNLIFLNPAHKHKLESWFREQSNQNNVKFKSNIIPNQIDKKWFKNLGNPKSLKDSREIKVVFVGELTPNKNIEFLLEVFRENWLDDYRFEVDVIGHINLTSKGRKYAKAITEQIARQKNSKFLGEIRDFEQLKKQISEADIFFMVSQFETFGLVYIEAISQGTPIIYTKGQGIDGYFKNGEVGHAVKAGQIEEARNAVKMIIDNYETMSINCLNRVQEFKETSIVEKCKSIYESIIE